MMYMEILARHSYGINGILIQNICSLGGCKNVCENMLSTFLIGFKTLNLLFFTKEDVQISLQKIPFHIIYSWSVILLFSTLEENICNVLAGHDIIIESIVPVKYLKS